MATKQVRPAKRRTPELGEEAPDFTLPSATGGRVSLSQFRGRKVLIEFYADEFNPV